MTPHDPCTRTGTSLSVQGSLVFEIFQTQADGAVHACASSVTAAQVSRLVSMELGMAVVQVHLLSLKAHSLTLGKLVIKVKE